MDDIFAIISGGEYASMPDIEKAKVVVACDKGYEYALAAGINPGVIVGDFDSYSGKLPSGVETIRLPIEKDDTDTMHAVRRALELGFTRISLYCALGGRLDHMLANLQAASYAAERGVPVQLFSRGCEAYIFSGGSVRIPARAGCSLSVLSLSDRCTGVSIRGTKYELEDVTVENSFPIGVSNQWRGTAEITVEQGVLAVIESKM
ncbi:MAG: thiamine diphosphokinase [Firmicutes bacterium]|nr:thiamine diphosphokinase [Bacillota bacterium]